MRRARGLRVSSTRDVCVFCANHQLTGFAPPTSSRTLSQRRYLNSSSKAPQYAAEALVYKEDSPPARPMSQAERARQQLQARFGSAHPTHHQGPQSSPTERTSAAIQSQHSTRPSSNQQRTSPPRLSNNGFAGSGRHQSHNRYTPTQRERARFSANMDSKPPVGNTPQFGLGNLRRKTDTRRRNESISPPIDPIQLKSSPAQVQDSKPTIRRKLDQDELDRLLGNDTIGNPKGETPSFARNTRTEPKCFHCGQHGHKSHECLQKPNMREMPRFGLQSRQSQQSQQLTSSEGSVTDAAEEWIRKQQQKGNDSSQTQRQVLYEDEKQRRSVDDRRRNRFRTEDTPVESRNRYEEPQTRRQTGFQRRARGRNMQEEDEEEERFVDKAERKRQRKAEKQAAKMAASAPTPVYLPEYVSVANLASILKQRVEDFVAKLEELGFEDVQNDHILNAEHAGLIAQEYNCEPIIAAAGEDGDIYPAPSLESEEYAQLPSRPPVVTIMGHVDHGKTTILDYIRSSSVAASEFGGITQHIGAFSVPLSSGKSITFLDTPGHSAFETMRARGANVTDIVVLVVAADDSVMPQTVEAIKHAQAAKVPIIVAINKIDKQQADPDKVKTDLGRYGIEVEDFGGDIQAVHVSGKTGQGIADLEEAISTQSEMLDHRADPDAKVEGTVLEGTTKKSGRIATVLVRSGTLRRGDILVAGTTWTRVRSLRNEAGAMVSEVGPGLPVEVDGWRDQPIAGDETLQAVDEQQATQVSELRLEKVQRVQMAKDMEAINESRRIEAERKEAEEAAKLAEQNGEERSEELKQESGPEIVNFIVKGDVSGSVEAVIDSISSIGNNEVGTRILRHGVGSPSEFDVQHAADAKGHIVNFNTTIPQYIGQMAEDKGVQILDSNIIYRVMEHVKALLSEKLAPKITQRVTGEADIAAVFEIGLGGKKKMKVAGSKVRNGHVEKGTRAKVIRKDEVIFDGVVTSLKNQKKDVEQMRKDTECGIAFEEWTDFKVGDKIQCYEEKSEKRIL